MAQWECLVPGPRFKPRPAESPRNQTHGRLYTWRAAPKAGRALEKCSSVLSPDGSRRIVISDCIQVTLRVSQRMVWVTFETSTGAEPLVLVAAAGFEYVLLVSFFCMDKTIEMSVPMCRGGV